MQSIAFYYPEGHEAHYETGHPERPARVETIKSTLEEAGFWKKGVQIPTTTVPTPILENIHQPTYLSRLQEASQHGRHLDTDTYTTPSSWELALKAAGGGIAVAEAVWSRQANRGFALTRPPGHHATSGRGMGFCLLNNVALAAEYLLQTHHARHISILDIDLHHGNGTQDIFYHRGDVQYLSTHQSPLYPGTGRLYETGTGPGEKSTVNLPLPPMSGDLAFITALDTLLLPLMKRFAPEMVLVSFGFDPHWRDPLGYLLLSADTFNKMFSRLCEWADENCQGRLAIFLEGGYDLEAGAACSLAIATALFNQPFEDPLGPSPHPEGSIWQATLSEACQIWDV
ncbi:MAG: histone deacetylase [Chloroflexota bacterium]